MVETYLSNLVSDWGGFERLIETLHDTGEVTVERNVILPGRSGAPRQIDVLLRHKQGLYEHLVVVECKYWSSPVERLHIDALATTVREVGASRGVIFSTAGFQSGAITEGKHQSIELFKVREPSDAEWGLPGRHVDLWIHIVSASLGAPQLPGLYHFSNRPHPTLNIHMGDSAETSNPIVVNGRSEITLEALVTRLASQATRQSYTGSREQFADGGFVGSYRYVVDVNFEPEQPFVIFDRYGMLFCPKLSFKLGVEVDQTRFQHDRGADFLFVLAVEDCVRHRVVAASRKKMTS